MGVRVAATSTTTSYIHWSQPKPIKPHSSLPSSQTLVASSISSPSSNRAISCRYVHRILQPSLLFGTSTSRLYRSREFMRFSSAGLDASSYEEFFNKVSELAQWFRISESNTDDENSEEQDSNPRDGERMMKQEEWPNFVERKANSIEIPISMRMIKRKMQWEDGVREAGESAYCSMKKAFSSVVFIIRELHSYTLQMREILFSEDLHGIIARVREEIHASFVWLFQQVFSHTPTLMVYVMILLANYTVYSMGSGNLALAASPTPVETTSTIGIRSQENQKFSSPTLKSFTRFSSGVKSTSIGGNNGGDGGKIRPIASGMDGDGWFEQSDQFRTIIPDVASPLGGTTREAESTSGQVNSEEELRAWNSIMDEAAAMSASLRDESLDQETMVRFVLPVKVEIEPDNYVEYKRTDLVYQTRLSQDPNNPLLLTNYAQFLWLVAHNYDRAEEYFKKAIKGKGGDAEAYNKYAIFLWRVRNDLWGAEESFLEAIDADPTNSYYAANYANFLWNTGGEDTCFPLE